MVGRLSGTLAGHWGRGVGLCNLSRLIAPAVPLAWVPGESAALATLRPWERREVRGEIAAPGREGAGALWAAGPPLMPRSLWPVPGCGDRCAQIRPRTAHNRWVRGAGENALGPD